MAKCFVEQAARDTPVGTVQLAAPTLEINPRPRLKVVCVRVKRPVKLRKAVASFSGATIHTLPSQFTPPVTAAATAARPNCVAYTVSFKGNLGNSARAPATLSRHRLAFFSLSTTPLYSIHKLLLQIAC